MIRRRLFLLVAGMVLSLIVASVAVSAQATTLTTTNTQTLGSTRFYACANELITVSGEYHSVFHVTFDPVGGSHIVFQHNSAGVSGTGLTSGATYVSVDRERSGATNIFGAPGFEMETVDTFLLIGSGDAPDLVVRVKEHITLTATGEFTVRITDVDSTCR